MSEIVKLRTRTEIEEEAAQWTWRLDDEAFTAADQQAFLSAESKGRFFRTHIRDHFLYERMAKLHAA